MTLTNNDPTLAAELRRVGMEPGASIEVIEGVRAETWSSDYAELYVLDAPSIEMSAIQDLLDRADAVVAKRLRSQREAGRILDAHVCIAVNHTVLKNENLTRESEASRFVSRKYWIDRAIPVEEILRRVTLTWVNVDPAAIAVSPAIAEEFNEMRRRISSLKGTAAANEFLTAVTK